MIEYIELHPNTRSGTMLLLRRLLCRQDVVSSSSCRRALSSAASVTVSVSAASRRTAVCGVPHAGYAFFSTAADTTADEEARSDSVVSHPARPADIGGPRDDSFTEAVRARPRLQSGMVSKFKPNEEKKCFEFEPVYIVSLHPYVTVFGKCGYLVTVKPSSGWETNLARAVQTEHTSGRSCVC